MEDRFISNMTFRVVLLGIREIIGENGLKTVLNRAGLKKFNEVLPPNNQEKNFCKASEVTLVDKNVADIFGNNGASAILFQVGRMQAKWGLDENPDTAKVAKEAFKGLNKFDVAKTAVKMTAAVLTVESGCKAWGEVDGEDILYNIDEATHCFDITSKTPVCFITSGFITGIMSWATGNDMWLAREENCMAMGAPHCTHRLRRLKG